MPYESNDFPVGLLFPVVCYYYAVFLFTYNRFIQGVSLANIFQELDNNRGIVGQTLSSSCD